ncbi:tyrosine-type recombinase/integrase [Sphingopyxis fribergensis]
MTGLTALKVSKARPGVHCDGKGLLLKVSPHGAKSWVLRVQHQGRRRDFGLGSIDWVSLADARASAATLRADIKRGIEPIQRITQREQAATRVIVPTFEQAARRCYDALKEGWDDKRRKNWLTSLENHIFPRIGNKPVDSIDSAVVRDALAPIWLEIPDTSRRILQRITAVLDFAHIQKWREAETSLRTVTKGLPRQTDRSRHFDAMPFDDVPAFVRRLIVEPTTITRDALRFLIYTAARSNEVRGAIWPEIDLEKAIWSIPAERMKARVAHQVPLPPQAVELLRVHWRARRSDEALVFSIKGTKPLSDMTLSQALRKMITDKATVHGFRSSFTDWASERTNFPKEVADKALAHQVPDKVEAAYRRTVFFDKRRKLMTAWAKFLHGPAPERDRSLSVDEASANMDTSSSSPTG